MKILDEFVFKVETDRATLIEERIRICLRPKPKWCTQKLYGWLLGQLLTTTAQKCVS